VNDSDLPFVIERDPFWDAYVETFQVLHHLGIELEFNKRIPIFQLYTRLQKQEQTDDVLHALYMLEIVKNLMARGLEPEHNKSRYV